MKKILKDVLKNMTVFDCIDYIAVANEDDKLIATGIDMDRQMVITGTFEPVDEFERFMVLGQLKFLKRVMDMEQVMDDAGTVDLVEGESFEGEPIYSGLKFKGDKVAISYHTVDPKSVKGRKGNSYPKMVELESDISFELSADTAQSFKQMANLQKMMVNKDDAVFSIKKRRQEVYLTFPYADNEIELVIAENVEGDIGSDLLFDTLKVERVMNLVTAYQNGKFVVSGKFIDIETETTVGKYQIRIPKRNAVKRL